MRVRPTRPPRLRNAAEHVRMRVQGTTIVIQRLRTQQKLCWASPVQSTGVGATLSYMTTYLTRGII